MAVLPITSANTNNLTNGSRNVVRTSAGIPYVVLVDATDSGIEVWKGSYLLSQTTSSGTYTFNDVCTKGGQSINPRGARISSVVVKLSKSGSPTGNIQVSIYDHSGTFGSSSVGTGSALATSDTISATSLDGTPTEKTFTFSTPYQTTNGNYYVVAVEYSSGTSSNTVIADTAASDVIEGNSCRYIGFWTADGTTDMYIKINYSDPVFSEQNSSGNPQTSGYGSVSCAIDSTDIIHIAYMYYNTKTSQLRYVTFNTGTDTFSGDTAVNSDIGGDPTALSNLYTAIAIDANDIPHIAYSEYPSKGGLPSLYYNNRIGGSWYAAGVEVEGGTSGSPCRNQDITFDLDNKPCISYFESTTDVVRAAIGNANDATSWTIQTIHTYSNTFSFYSTSIAVDSSGNHYVACNYYTGATSQLAVYKHNYADGWTTWQSPITVASSCIIISLVINSSDIYIFYEGATSHDIIYNKYSGTWGSGTWLGETALETGTFNSVKAKWAFFNNYDAEGNQLVKVTNYYVDGSDAAVTDPGGVWTNDSNLTDSDTETSATSSTFGSETSNYLQAEGTNAPSSGGTIVKVLWYPMVGGISIDDPFTTIPAPAGGWTWAKIQGLEIRVAVINASNATFWIYEDGNAGGTELASLNASYSLLFNVYQVQIQVWTTNTLTSIDYIFVDETATPDVQFNTLTLTTADTTWKPRMIVF